MNLKRFTARTSRDALALVKAAFGDDAVVMSTRPCAEGVEVLAMAPESVQQLERVGHVHRQAAASQPRQRAAASGEDMRGEQRVEHRAERTEVRAEQRFEQRVQQRHEQQQQRQPSLPQQRTALRQEPPFDAGVEQDVQQLEMSTLSFQDYVRERMLKRREAERTNERTNERTSERNHAHADFAETAQPLQQAPVATPIAAARARQAVRPAAQHDEQLFAQAAASAPARQPAATRRDIPVLRDELHLSDQALHQPAPAHIQAHAQAQAHAVAAPATPVLHHLPARGEQVEMMSELRSMRGLIEQRFGALAFMEKLQRQPRQAHLAQRLLDAGFSPALIRKLAQSLPADNEDETAWAANVLERNLLTAERDAPLEDVGGVYALVGATGVGKTTSTAKLAAAFATKHGAGNLGLITLDAYRVGAHEQLRTYGRILGVPVHTAHDRASLEDLLDLLSAKRMILIDTAGMAQRDSRTRELLDMLSHRAISRILVVNASAQGETIEDQLAAYAAQHCRGLILSKLDEAVKLGPALDSMIRHKLKVLAVANGQRVPEDWHRLSANALVQRALKGGGGPAWKLDDNDVSLIFAGMGAAPAGAGTAGAPAPVAHTLSA